MCGKNQSLIDEIFLHLNIPYEIVSHTNRGEFCVKDIAESLSLPQRVIVKTLYFQRENNNVVALVSGDCAVDLKLLSSNSGVDLSERHSEIDSDSFPKSSNEIISPLNFIKNREAFLIVLDEKLLEVSFVIIPTDEKNKSVKLDSRFLPLFNFKVGQIAFEKTSDSKKSGFDILLERGFIDRITDEKKARELLNDEKTSVYIGFDPTADSLHVGSLVPIMALANLQRAGHPIITLVGGATGLVGDPSGKTEMRKMLSSDEIEFNIQGMKKQFSAFIDFDSGRGKIVNNAHWFGNKGYLEFLREVGIHFSVNKMLTAECFKTRMEKGLSFLEFNYMLLQAYDFLVLSRQDNCYVQMGGSDQWGNICAGVELIRRAKGEEAVGVTFPLLMNTAGKKFGKTEQGNIWFDGNRTTPYEYFQFWRNTEDCDVRRFLLLFTFLPIKVVRELTSDKSQINLAKKVLAFITTSVLHGELPAVESTISAESLFKGDTSSIADILKKYDLISEESFVKMDKASRNSSQSDAIAQIKYSKEQICSGISLSQLLVDLEFASSKSAGRRLINQGGVQINNQKVTNPNTNLQSSDFDQDGVLLVKVGKKRFGRVVLSNN